MGGAGCEWTGQTTNQEGRDPALSGARILPFISSGWHVVPLQPEIGLNAREKLETLISNYEERVGKLKNSLGARSERPTVSVLKPREDVLEAYTDRFYVGRILEEVGVRRPENQIAEDPQKISRELGREAVGEVDADVIFVMAGGGGEDAKASRDALDRLRSNPLWGRLRAVKDGRVHEVDPSAWFITSGPQAANAVLDDLEKHLLGGDG